MCFFIKLKTRMLYSVLLAIVGIASFATGLYFRGTLLNDFYAGFYTGTGGGLLAVSIVFAIKCFILMQNEEKRKKVEVEENDERKKFITDRMGFVTCMTILPMLYVASLIAGFFNSIVFFTLLGATVLMLLVMCTSNLILRAKY